ncbi:DUF2986 domain-containing protein [Catenovulum maritimum]|uniref:DUF2986 domain-containing protein n=1 Tax=Catenovulum maritimum TaxID=1513271 RepID=A0A0J8GU57_9ALTE|nr:DUF2986 domain-containing protein [Catenovulum maritimum]KMT64218.1 hypothetical protein XM47_15750 [Catenovulum maritimum]
MNRKKKIQQIHQKRLKKAKAKLHTPNKPKYISKADRAKMEAEEAETLVENEQASTQDETAATEIAK